MDNRQVIGRCSLCGGRVLQHQFLHIVGPFPPAECERCGAVEEGRGPTIPTHSYCLAYVEWIAHTVIDRCKCEDILTFNQDQILHLACKVGYVAGLMAMGVQ